MPPLPDPLNAFVARPQVPVSSSETGPLAGLRLGVKDIFDVAGYRSGWGNPARLAEAPVAEVTAPAVKRLLDAGARFVGKTQTDELAFSLLGQNAHFPHPINPAAPERVTGGSSSGSAAAVAGGLADLAIGSDTGGSIRAPASFCGLIGLRPTHGLIPLDGIMPFAPSLDTVGWFARDINSYARVAEVMLGDLGGPRRLSRAIRLAELDALTLGAAEAEAYRLSRAAVASKLGAPQEAPPLADSLDDLYWCFRRIQGYEGWISHGAWLSAADRGLGPGVRERFAYGETVTAAQYEAEQTRRAVFRDGFAKRLGGDAVLVLPTVPGAAPLATAPFDSLQAYRERALRLLCLSGLSGLPQLTLPLGTVEGAPFGLSLVGPARSDRALIELGRQLLEAVGKA